MTGISEALVATAVGLAVAIPAVVAYNLFTRGLKNRVTAGTGAGARPGRGGEEPADRGRGDSPGARHRRGMTAWRRPSIRTTTTRSPASTSLPLVDIVLVLLIIFMVTANFIVRETMEVDLPRAANAGTTVQGLLNVVLDRTARSISTAR